VDHSRQNTGVPICSAANAYPLAVQRQTPRLSRVAGWRATSPVIETSAARTSRGPRQRPRWSSRGARVESGPSRSSEGKRTGNAGTSIFTQPRKTRGDFEVPRIARSKCCSRREGLISKEGPLDVGSVAIDDFRFVLSPGGEVTGRITGRREETQTRRRPGIFKPEVGGGIWRGG